MDDKLKIYIVTATAFATIMSCIITAIINMVLNKKNNRVSQEQRFIDIISAERVKWINTLRDLFSQYDKTASIQLNRFIELSTINKSEQKSLGEEIIYLNNHVELFLNPTERVTKKLIEVQTEITKVLLHYEPDSNFNSREISQNLRSLHYLQQVILKSEWKRVKEENIKGKEISEEQMNNIFMITAEKIDPTEYTRFLKDSFEK